MSIFNLLAGYNYDIRSAVQALVAVVGGGGGGGGGSTIVPTADVTTTTPVVTTPVVVVAAAGQQIFSSRSLVGSYSLSLGYGGIPFVAVTEGDVPWYARNIIFSEFMRTHGIKLGFQSPNWGVPTQTINFPATGTYTFKMECFQTGSISIDGVTVFSQSGNATKNIVVTAGNHNIDISAFDFSGPIVYYLNPRLALTITVSTNITTGGVTTGGVTTTIPGTKSPGGGGGGAGQAVLSSPEIKAGITYTVTVGSGGAGGSSTTSSAGTAGSLSSISGGDLNTISAAGGLGGAGPPSSTNGGNGGASGGSAFAGGTGASTGGLFGGGGGGAGGVGGSGTSTSQPAGGSGVTPSYSVNTLGTGGAGGGVIGLSQVNGTANRGIGGQGGGYGYNGGSGGSGTVLIATSPYYFLSYTAGVPSAVAKTTYDSRDVYTFTASTSIIFSSTVTLTGFAVTPSSIVFGAAAPTITVPTSNYPLGSIQYTSSNPAVATINQTTGAIAIISAGTTNLSATNIVPSPLVNVSQTVTLTVLPDAGHQLFTTPGSFNWTAPAGVTSVCVVCIGGGGGGGQASSGGNGGSGGGLGWKNNIPVTPGTSYPVVVGAGGAVRGAGGDSYFISLATVSGRKGVAGGPGNGSSPTNKRANAGGTFTGDGGGNGGGGGWANDSARGGGGGGGAAGYSGDGGGGGNYTGAAVSSGAGGGGGGGYGGSAGTKNNAGGGGGGGGVGIFGQGANGAAATTARQGGSGGSGGDNGGSTSIPAGAGGLYGGGGGGGNGGNGAGGTGRSGAVRILWGAGRAFPATNVNSETS